MKIKSYKDLDIWRKGIVIVNKIYDLTEKFPRKEIYGLASQMQRAAVSIPSNIAEGFSRNHTKEYVHFLYVAVSSCAELDTQLVISKERGYVNDKEFVSIEEDIDHESRMIMRLIISLKSRIK